MNYSQLEVNELRNLFEKPEGEGPWGLSTCINLYDCDGEVIRSKEAITAFTIELCERIGVNRYGEPVIVHFGREKRVEGYSLVQLIETSLVSGHFANCNNSVYIDIFSCKFYDPALAYDYCSTFFKSQRSTYQVVLRD